MSTALKRPAGSYKMIKATVPRPGPREARAGQFVVVRSFNSPAVRAQVRALRDRVTASPEAATAFLRDAGILTPTGRVSKRYGG